MLTALTSECRQLWRLRGLLAVLTRREIGARVAGSAGGLLWVWLPPLLTVAAYFLVFDVVFGMRLGGAAPTARVGTYPDANCTALRAAIAARTGVAHEGDQLLRTARRGQLFDRLYSHPPKQPVGVAIGEPDQGPEGSGEPALQRRHHCRNPTGLRHGPVFRDQLPKHRLGR